MSTESLVAATGNSPPAPTQRTERSKRTPAAFISLLLTASFFSVLFALPAVAANPAYNLDQCANGKLGPPLVHTSPCDWVNGNLGQSKAHYVEGESVPYRAILTNIPSGAHTIDIQYDVRHSSKNALDYLTDFQRIAETVDPCAGHPGCALLGTFAIPVPAGTPQPGTSFNALPGAERLFSIYRGGATGTASITGIAYVSQGALTAAQSATVVRVSFTTTTPDVILAWGGHIASSVDWGLGNSAPLISGSPYHMAINGLDGSGGQQDRSLSADAVVPVQPLGASLTVVKTVTNDDGGTAVASNFLIHVRYAGNHTDVPGSPQPGSSIGTSYVHLPAGDYIVGEDAVAGYALGPIVGNCDPETGAITLANDEIAECDLANDDQAAHLIVVKHVVNADGGTQVAADWEMNVTAAGASQLFAGDENGTDVTLGANAAYTVAEDGPAGYAASFSADCAGSLAPGQTKTCTVTNDDIRPVLTVVKHVVNDDGGLQAAADWTMSVAGADAAPAAFPGDEAGTAVSLAANAAYAVGEDGPAGYAADLSADCAGSLLPGEEKTCTVTNDDIAPSLQVVKHVVNDDGGTQVAADWTLHINGADAAPAAFPGDEAGTNATLLANADYNVTEEGPAGYAADFSADCAGSLLPGDAKTCTVTNNDTRPTLIVIKHVVNDDGGLQGADDWTLHVHADGASPADFAGDEAGTEVSLPANLQFNVTEEGPAGYAAAFSADCAGTLLPGETKTCTVTNDDIRPRLVVVKHVINDDGGTLAAADFLLDVDGADADPAAFAGNETGTEVSLLANAAYAVGEDAQPGYAMDLSADCAGSLLPGETKTCTVTNDDIRPRLTVTKVVVTDDGGTAVVADFPLAVGGVPVTSGVEATFAAGDYVVSEAGQAGYAATITGDCDPGTGNVTLAVGDAKACTITNDDIAPILHVVKHVINNGLGTAAASDFLINVTGVAPSPAGFLGSEDGVAVDLDAGPYLVTEGAHAGYAVSYSAGCAGILAPGADVTCTITNDDISLVTRTQGFWDSHTAFTKAVFHNQLSGTMGVGAGGHVRAINTDGKLFGAWESSVSKLTTGGKRLPVDQARMVLLQQLVTAKLNCAAFGCPASVTALIASADLAFAGSNAAAMTAAAALLDQYNNSGDGAAVPPVLGVPGAATPKLSAAAAAGAGLVFWNTP